MIQGNASNQVCGSSRGNDYRCECMFLGMKIKEAVLAEANEILCYNFCCVQDPITVALKVVSVSGEFQANYTCRFIENFLVPVQSPKSASVLRHFSCCTIL